MRLPLLALLALLSLAACDASEADPAPDTTAPDVALDQGAPDAASDLGAPDARLPDTAVDSLPDATPPPTCALDRDCEERDFCDEHGACQPPAAPFISPTRDGATRVGAASFDITPTFLERWIDRAGPACPKNRKGRYDGRLDQPTPEDPCQDGFEDVDLDGHFDAVWLAGAGLDRPAFGVDSDNLPAGRVLVLTRDDQLFILISLDLYALDAAQVRGLTRRLAARLGVPPSNLTVHVTGNRSAPDAVGLYGPSLALSGDARAQALNLRLGSAAGLLSTLPYTSGLDERWLQEVVRRAAAAAQQASLRLTPASIQVTTVELPLSPDPVLEGPFVLPDEDQDGLENEVSELAGLLNEGDCWVSDQVFPLQRDRTLRAVVLSASATHERLAVVAGLGAAPAAVSEDVPRLSADYPGEVRRALEQAYPGAVALWLTSASADTVVAGGTAFIPAVDEYGDYVDAAGTPVSDPWLAAQASRPAQAIGRRFARLLIDTLGAAEVHSANLTIQQRFSWVPLTNPRFAMAARLGLLPLLEDWLSGRVPTTAWADGATTPTCGGLGCIRHRIDLVDLGPIQWLFTPGALDDAYIQGRGAGSLYLSEYRAASDVDGDSVADVDDPELWSNHIRLAGPVNPQRFDAIPGLATSKTWVVGRTNGGVGTFRPATEQIPLFEGQHDALSAFVETPENASIELCQMGYPCAHLTLGELHASLMETSGEALANLSASHELWLVDADFGAKTTASPWRLWSATGELKAEGEAALLGPGSQAFILEADLAALGLTRGDVLEASEQKLTVGGLVNLVLAGHPSVGDALTAESPSGGDFVYDSACELLYGGFCPDRRVPTSQDPNQVLPRTP